jgi:hypothetical protein
VNQKKINILFLTLFSWNALFGAVGGLLICIHDDLRMHSDLGQKNEAACETAHASCESSQHNISAAEHCMDIELDAIQSVLVKSEHSDLDHQNTSTLLIPDPNFNFGLTLRELAPDLQAQAPPGLTPVSVHTVQLTQLRI